MELKEKLEIGFEKCAATEDYLNQIKDYLSTKSPGRDALIGAGAGGLGGLASSYLTGASGLGSTLAGAGLGGAAGYGYNQKDQIMNYLAEKGYMDQSPELAEKGDMDQSPELADNPLTNPLIIIDRQIAEAKRLHKLEKELRLNKAETLNKGKAEIADIQSKQPSTWDHFLSRMSNPENWWGALDRPAERAGAGIQQGVIDAGDAIDQGVADTKQYGKAIGRGAVEGVQESMPYRAGSSLMDRFTGK